jgi:hypothetical protein
LRALVVIISLSPSFGIDKIQVLLDAIASWIGFDLFLVVVVVAGEGKAVFARLALGHFRLLLVMDIISRLGGKSQTESTFL